jgi:hypothetical protein
VALPGEGEGEARAPAALEQEKELCKGALAAWLQLADDARRCRRAERREAKHRRDASTRTRGSSALGKRAAVSDWEAQVAALRAAAASSDGGSCRRREVSV